METTANRSPSDLELRMLRTFAEEAFQRLGPGIELLNLPRRLEMLQQRRTLGAAETEPANRLSDTELALRPPPPQERSDVRALFHDMTAWFERLESLVDLYIGPRSPLDPGPLPSATTDLPAPAKVLHAWIEALQEHQTTVAVLSAQVLKQQIPNLAQNAVLIRRLAAELQAEGVFEKALAQYEVFLREGWRSYGIQETEER